MSDHAVQCNMAKCTISTTLKIHEEAIETADVDNGVTTVHSKQRPQIMDEVDDEAAVNLDKRKIIGW